MLYGSSTLMGSPANELGHGSQEGPQHWVTFAQQFAVGEFALTFEEWEACIVDGGCNGYRPPDRGWGRGRERPAAVPFFFSHSSRLKWSRERQLRKAANI